MSGRRVRFGTRAATIENEKTTIMTQGMRARRPSRAGRFSGCRAVAKGLGRNVRARRKSCRTMATDENGRRQSWVSGGTAAILPQQLGKAGIKVHRTRTRPGRHRGFAAQDELRYFAPGPATNPKSAAE